MTSFATLLLIGQLLTAGSPPSAVPAAAESRMLAPVVAGRVVTDADLPLPGVFVAVQGTPQVTSTNSAGDFVLSLTSAKSVLVFKCQGYRDQTLTVGASNALTVKMYPITKSAPVDMSTPMAAAPAPTDKPEVLKYAEEPPTFPGGETAYRAYMREHAHFPEEAQKSRASGTVYVGFVVDETGRILDVELVKGVGFGFDQEALRLIRLMPWWNPGRQGGKVVRVSKIVSVPFVFREE